MEGLVLLFYSYFDLFLLCLEATSLTNQQDKNGKERRNMGGHAHSHKATTLLLILDKEMSKRETPVVTKEIILEFQNKKKQKALAYASFKRLSQTAFLSEK